MRVTSLALAFLLFAAPLSAQTPTPQQLQDAAAQFRIASDALVKGSDALAKAAADLAGTPVVPPPVVVPPPSPCHTTAVPAGADLQAAIAAAAPCDTLVLAAGATFAGNFVLPVKTGTPPAPYTPRVTITSSGTLPTGRVGPANASAMAKLQALPGGLPALRTATAAKHYAVIGIEFLPNPGGYYDIVVLGDGTTGAQATQTTLAQVPDDLVFDRCYLHGDPVLGQKRGITLNSANTTVSNSYISDMKANGQDSQALGGWNGPGPFTITNNYLEAAGENIIFGGGDSAIPNLVPSNITITGNYITKPLAWRTPGLPWSVKNLVEMKNAAHVLIAGNVIENVWQSGQNGFAIVLTPRNQDGTATWSGVSDVTIRDNVVRHAAAGINMLGTDDVHPSQPLTGVLITNNLFYDIDQQKWSDPNNGSWGSGRLFQFITGPQHVTITHNTMVASATAPLNSAFTFGNYGDTKLATNLVVANNVLSEGEYGVGGDNVGIGNVTLSTYAPGWVFANNILIHGAAAGNYTYPVSTSVLRPPVVDASFRVLATVTAASNDGKPVGVDMAALLSANVGVDLTK